MSFISEQFEGEEIPKNLRKMMARGAFLHFLALSFSSRSCFAPDDTWMGLDGGYQPLFLLPSKEGKVLLRESYNKGSTHIERFVTVANGFLVVFSNETKEKALKVGWVCLRVSLA